MNIVGEYKIGAPREIIWRALNDPEVLRRCIPGCKELDKKSDTEFVTKVALKIGPVAATFSGTVQLDQLDPPNGYVIVGQGQGGVAGFAKGNAVVRLAEESGLTILTYDAKAELGGKLASLGGRLIQATTRKLADEFFGRFSSIVTTALSEEVNSDAFAAREPSPRTLAWLRKRI